MPTLLGLMIFQSSKNGAETLRISIGILADLKSFQVHDLALLELLWVEKEKLTD